MTLPTIVLRLVVPVLLLLAGPAWGQSASPGGERMPPAPPPVTVNSAVPAAAAATPEEALISRLGLDPLAQELDHLWQAAQAHVTLRRHQLATWERHVDLLAAGTIAWRLTELLGLLALAAAVRRRYPAARIRLRRFALSRSRRISVKVVVERWLDVADAVLPGLGWLAFLHAAFFLVGTPAAEVRVLRTVLLAHAWYRVGLAATHLAVANAAATRLDRLPPDLKARIRRSLRLAGRYALISYVVQALAAMALGRGALSGLVQTLAWLGTVPVAVVLIREWRCDIADAFLRTHPESRLAQVVARTREQRLGFFVTVAAFAYVAARGLGFTLRNALWRFEQTRKALAYLFRRQLERQAEEHGHAAGDVGLLPPELVAAFTSEPPAQTVAHFPRLAEVAQLVARWQAARGGAAVALAGPAGIGKTTWLGELVRATAVNTVWLSPERRIADRHELAALLAGALGLAADSDLAAIQTALRDGPPRLIVVDRSENLLVRAVGGLDVYRAFVELVEQTVGQTFWVCAFDRYAWDFVDRLKLGSGLFTSTVILPPWDEEAIGQLIDQRMAAAGFRADYADLLLDRVEPRAVPRELPRTIERFQNLLWDYADGNPRLAMHFWLRSLLPGSGDRVRVRLFRAPLADEVEILDEQTRFVLACVVNHGGMTVAEAARSLRFSGAFCEAALTHLHLGGILDRQDDTYRLSTHWQEAVLVYLRRKHLLFD